jgi:hypothetical protein
MEMEPSTLFISAWHGTHKPTLSTEMGVLDAVNLPKMLGVSLDSLVVLEALKALEKGYRFQVKATDKRDYYLCALPGTQHIPTFGFFDEHA